MDSYSLDDDAGIAVGRTIYYLRMPRTSDVKSAAKGGKSNQNTSHGQGSWRRGTLTAISGNRQTCSVQDSESNAIVEKFPLHPLRILPISITAGNGINDMVDLDLLHEAAMSENILVRYNLDKIYTNVGPILVSVNPYRIIPNMYTEETRKAYVSGSKTEPHLYSTADAAFRGMQRGENQSILITGESGAGKTEATKIIIQYLLDKTPHQEGAGDDMTAMIKRRIMESNPVLEAFGNAKTLKNDNSSRFGKFFELHYDNQGSIVGAVMTRYLLEKSRVVHQSEGERNYHIFYQLCASQTYAHLLHNLKAEDFHYLDQSNCHTIDDVDDNSDFDEVLNALDCMGFSPERVEVMFKVLVAILFLGNMRFEADSKDYATLVNEDCLIYVAELLDVNAARLRSALLQRTMRAGGGGRHGSVYKVPHDVIQACDARDAIAKELYATLFDSLFDHINGAIYSSNSRRGTLPYDNWIGVLDIFGFENMAKNSFEQLCINYANERLHQFFVTHFFHLEKQIYDDEGIDTSFIRFSDNQQCVSMIEERKKGLLGVLQEDCRLKTSTDKSFVEKAKQTLKGNEYFEVSKFDPLEFHIIHYAGLIIYDATGFLEKNRDTITADLESVLMSTNNEILSLRNKSSGALAAFNPNADTKTLQGKSVSERFKAQLIDLMAKLGSSCSHYVRCIKPNEMKRANKFNDAMVLQQLRYSGVLESIHIRRAGYASRLDKVDFIDIFGVLCGGVPRHDIDGRCKMILKRSGVDLGEVKIGHTKIFFKRNMLPHITEEMGKYIRKYVVIIQKVWRGVRQRRKYKIYRAAVLTVQTRLRSWKPFRLYKRYKKSALILQKFVRGWRCRKMVKQIIEDKRREAKERARQSLGDKLGAMEAMINRMVEKQAIIIQAAYRRHLVMKRQKEKIAAVRKIQQAWRARLVEKAAQELEKMMTEVGAQFDSDGEAGPETPAFLSTKVALRLPSEEEERGGTSPTVLECHAFCFPGRIVFASDASLKEPLYTMPIGDATQVLEDEGSLESETFRCKIKIVNSVGKELVLATENFTEQTVWRRSLLSSIKASGGLAMPSFAASWLRFGAEGEKFCVQTRFALLVYDDATCMGDHLDIPLRVGETHLIRPRGGGDDLWFAACTEEENYFFATDSHETLRSWLACLPDSLLFTRAELEHTLAEAHVSVYEKDGHATAGSIFSSSSGCSSGWQATYAVMTHTHIHFYSDITLRSCLGEFSLHDVRVHPHDSKNGPFCIDNKNSSSSSSVDVKKQYCFRLTRPGRVQVELAVESEEKAKEWMALLSIKSGGSSPLLLLQEEMDVTRKMKKSPKLEEAKERRLKYSPRPHSLFQKPMWENEQLRETALHYLTTEKALQNMIHRT